MIERCIWDQSISNVKKEDQSLFERPGLFFAIIGEGAFREEEVTFAETFFDGIIYFDAEPGTSADPTISYEFSRFPLVDRYAIPEKMDEYWTNTPGSQYNPFFSPDYTKCYEFRPMAGSKFSTKPSSRLSTEASKNSGER